MATTPSGSYLYSQGTGDSGDRLTAFVDPSGTVKVLPKEAYVNSAYSLTDNGDFIGSFNIRMSHELLSYSSSTSSVTLLKEDRRAYNKTNKTSDYAGNSTGDVARFTSSGLGTNRVKLQVSTLSGNTFTEIASVSFRGRAPFGSVSYPFIDDAGNFVVEFSGTVGKSMHCTGNIHSGGLACESPVAAYLNPVGLDPVGTSSTLGQSYGNLIIEAGLPLGYILDSRANGGDIVTFELPKRSWPVAVTPKRLVVSVSRSSADKAKIFFLDPRSGSLSHIDCTPANLRGRILTAVVFESGKILVETIKGKDFSTALYELTPQSGQRASGSCTVSGSISVMN